MVRLHESTAQPPLVIGDITIEPARRTASCAGRDLGLTAREFDLLLALTHRPGRVLSWTQLLEQVWGCIWDIDPHYGK
ncbi:winged helix-turn-helix domain-containing protein [Streptomyces sp. NPDC051664]|uniref:winged helix-turn-helix domain-containing protein n=1 Tax=Streptomyces sp. NPDC051664 TaxID=3365668 RepID=UPI00379C0045